jgi:hypothetical protein
MASGHSAIVTDLLPTTESRTVLLSTQRRLVTFGHSVIVTDDALSLFIPSATPCPFIASAPLRPLSSNWINSFECATTADWVAITASTRVLNQPPEPLDCPRTYAVMPSAFGSPPHHPQHSLVDCVAGSVYYQNLDRSLTTLMQPLGHPLSHSLHSPLVDYRPLHALHGATMQPPAPATKPPRSLRASFSLSFS